jgi:glycosyltransferase involved in cell wall biosynthesis
MTMKKIKLLFLIHDLRGRGAERFLATLLTRFDRTKYQLGLFVYHDTFAMSIPADVEIISAHLKPAPPSFGLFGKVARFFIKVFALTRAVNAYKPDVVLSVAGTNVALMLARHFYQGRPKIVLSEHTLPFIDNLHVNNRLERYFLNKAISTTVPRAEMVIVPSQGVSDHLSSNYGIPSEKITVIPNPVDIEQIKKAADAGPAFPFPRDNSFRIGFVGGFTREKNVGCLLRAFAILRRAEKPVRLFLIGDGGERAPLEDLAKELSVADAVHFLGYQNNPYSFLKEFDALVVPSYYETFSYVILEAIACGVPVVSSKWPSCEYMYRDSENCLLFPVDGHDQLAQAVLRLMTDKGLGARLVRNGQDLLKRCNVDTVAGQYDEAITRVLRRGATDRP